MKIYVTTTIGLEYEYLGQFFERIMRDISSDDVLIKRREVMSRNDQSVVMADVTLRVESEGIIEHLCRLMRHVCIAPCRLIWFRCIVFNGERQVLATIRIDEKGNCIYHTPDML